MFMWHFKLTIISNKQHINCAHQKMFGSCSIWRSKSLKYRWNILNNFWIFFFFIISTQPPIFSREYCINILIEHVLIDKIKWQTFFFYFARLRLRVFPIISDPLEFVVHYWLVIFPETNNAEFLLLIVNWWDFHLKEKKKWWINSI